MYTATVTLDGTARSLLELVNAALDSDADISAEFNGRCFQVTLLPLTGSTASLASFGGTPETNNGIALPIGVYLTFQSPTGNQISIKEIFLFGGGTVGVMILVL